jgi:hypothetical protein
MGIKGNIADQQYVRDLPGHPTELNSKTVQPTWEKWSKATGQSQ